MKEGRVSFAVACGLGANFGDDGVHELSMNGKKLLEFNTPYVEKLVVSSPDAAMTFQPSLVDGNNDLFGVMTITPAKELLRFGQGQRFEVKGKACASRAWFMLSQAPSSGEVIAPGIAEKIASIKAAQRETERRNGAGVCDWPGGRKAAVSLVGAGFSRSAIEGAVFADMATDTALDKVVENGGWLIERYPEGADLQARRDYLAKLDCVVWAADADAVLRYARARRQAKLLVEDKGPGRLQASLVGLPPGYSGQALTVQVRLPANTWRAEAFDQAKRPVPVEYIVPRGLRFDMKPEAGAVDIHYKTYDDGREGK